jgi:START domain
VNARIVRRDFPQKGDILVIIKSVKHPEAPEVSGIVRAEVIFNFMRYRPLPDGTTQFMYVGLNEANGLVPNFVMKQFASKIIPGMMEQLSTLAATGTTGFGPEILEKITPYSEA